MSLPQTLSSLPDPAGQDRRLFAGSVATALLLFAGALGSVASAEEIGSHALEGAGIGAMLTAVLGFALLDRAVAQLGSAHGSNRMGILLLGIAGLVWAMIRVGLGDVWIVPAVTGLLWITMQAAFFTEPADEPDTDEVAQEDAPAPDPT